MAVQHGQETKPGAILPELVHSRRSWQTCTRSGAGLNPHQHVRCGCSQTSPLCCAFVPSHGCLMGSVPHVPGKPQSRCTPHHNAAAVGSASALKQSQQVVILTDLVCAAGNCEGVGNNLELDLLPMISACDGNLLCRAEILPEAVQGMSRWGPQPGSWCLHWLVMSSIAARATR